MCSQFLGALTRWAVVYFEKPDSKQMLISQVLVAAGLIKDKIFCDDWRPGPVCLPGQYLHRTQAINQHILSLYRQTVDGY